MSATLDPGAVRAADMLADLGPERALAVARFLDDATLVEVVRAAEFRRRKNAAMLGVPKVPGVDVLARARPEALAALLAREEPQLVAIVLAILPAVQAAAVLSALPAKLRERALANLALCSGADAEVVGAVTEALVRLLSDVAPSIPVAGAARALNLFVSGGQDAVEYAETLARAVELIAREEPALAESLRGVVTAITR